jgi:glycosyltransferase involved in cell wall biosynthesis
VTTSDAAQSPKRPLRRVLHVVPHLEQGGAERQLRYLCPQLASFGWEPHVACLRGGPSLTALARAGVATHRIACAGHYDPRIALAIARLIRELRPAVLQTWLPLMDIVGGLVARGRGVPWVVSERTLPSAYPDLPKMRLRNRLVVHAAAVVSNSVDADAFWSARLAPRVLHRVIQNGIPLEEIERAGPADPAAHGLAGDRPLVTFVGRLDEGKNVGTVLDVLARVTREGPAEALLCGDGTLLAAARERLAREGLGERVRAPGYVGDVPSVLKRAAVFLSLSRYEGMPNAVMEAAAAGCPIVLSDIPAHRKVLTEGEALFVPAEDVDAASDAVLACLRDPGAAKERAARARVRAEGWSLQAAARAYASLYDELTSGRAT